MRRSGPCELCELCELLEVIPFLRSDSAFPISGSELVIVEALHIIFLITINHWAFETYVDGMCNGSIVGTRRTRERTSTHSELLPSHR